MLNPSQIAIAILPSVALAEQEKVESIASRWDWEWLRKWDWRNQRFKAEYEIPFIRLVGDGSEDRFASAVCIKLLRDIPDALFVACVTSDQTWLLCSDKHGNNTNVAAIAQQFGGGGYRNASKCRPEG